LRVSVICSSNKMLQTFLLFYILWGVDAFSFLGINGKTLLYHAYSKQLIGRLMIQIWKASTNELLGTLYFFSTRNSLCSIFSIVVALDLFLGHKKIVVLQCILLWWWYSYIDDRLPLEASCRYYHINFVQMCQFHGKRLNIG